MASCPNFNSAIPIITKDNIHELNPRTYSTTHGTVIQPSCNPGYRLVGVPEFECKNGAWDYPVKPYCTNEPEEVAPDENTWILIGVVCGVAFIIITILVVMIVAIWYRDRKRNKQQEMMMYNVNRMDRKDYIYDPRPPYTGPNDIEMYSGPLGAPLPALPPPPYEYGSRKGEEERTRYEKRPRQHYRARDDDPRDREVHRYRDRDPYERKIRSREFLSEVGRRSHMNDAGNQLPRFVPRMYLPEMDKEFDSELKSVNYRSRSADDLLDSRKANDDMERSRYSTRMYLPENERSFDRDQNLFYHRSRSFDDLSDRGRYLDRPFVRHSTRDFAFEDLDDIYDRPRDSRLWRNA